MNLETNNNTALITENLTMESLEITAPRKVTSRQILLPAPQAGEVRIKMEGCGLCASNLPVWEGRDWFTYPIAPGNPGHEGWGIIDCLGEGVNNFSLGDRVAAITYHAFSEYDTCEASNLVRLPKEMDDIPFPGEPLGCAMNIFERSDIQAGQTIAVVGCGFLGALLIQLAEQAGARVIAISRKKSSLELAKRQGAHEVISMENHQAIIEKVQLLTDNKLCDRVLEATGKQEPLNLAAELTGVRGKLIIAGYHQDGSRQVNMQLWNWRGLDVINAHERDPEIYLQGMKKAVAAVIEGRLDPRPLYTHIFPANELQKAFEVQHQNPEGFTKALILFKDYESL